MYDTLDFASKMAIGWAVIIATFMFITWDINMIAVRTIIAMTILSFVLRFIMEKIDFYER